MFLIAMNNSLYSWQKYAPPATDNSAPDSDFEAYMCTFSGRKVYRQTVTSPNNIEYKLS